MKQLTSEEIKSCQIQGNIFAKSTQLKCSSKVFIRRFMLSKTCERMDKNGILFDSFSEEDIYAELEKENGKFNYGKIKIGNEVLFWIGYIYRYWSICCDMSSKEIFSIQNSSDMISLYLAYHTLDPKVAIERILEANNINLEKDFLTEGVRVLRKIRNRNN